MSDYNRLSAVKMRQMLGVGELAAVDLLTDCIAAIDDVNPQVNAVVTPCFDHARQQALACDAARANGGPCGPLHGLPVLIKDLMDTAGLRTTYGSRCFADHVPNKDALIVERLKAAGAIVLGKTNTPEFGAGANTRNLVFGATGNPFDPALTSGGSSGGSAAALACDMAPLATGSDLGGSLRIPASFCSVVGMRPTPGVVASRSYVSGFSPLWCDGPMARTVEDVALMLSAIAGRDAADPLSSPATGFDFVAFENGDAATDPAQLCVGFSTDLGVAAIDDAIRDVFAQRLPVVSGCFGASAPVDIDLSETTEVFKILRAESMAASYGALVAQNAGQIGPNVIGNVRDAERYSLTDAAWANAAHTRIYRRFQALFDEIDVLICPATAVTPFPLGQNHPDTINGAPLEGYFAWVAITSALSLTGCPVVTLPCGLDHSGMPFGVQLVGRPHGDLALLKIAHRVELALMRQGLGRVIPQP